ncbi:MAG: TetR/AcrR family transcriptional regulator [Pseudomonadota bacterium]
MSTRETSRPREQYHHGDLRTALVAATRQLVEEKGQDGFSVSDACRLAGVSTAAPYRHFSDRNAMLEAVALDAMAEMADQMDADMAGHEPGSPDAIAALGTGYVRFATANPGTFRLAFAAHDDSEKLEEAGHRCYGRVLDQIRMHFGDSEITDRVRHQAFLLWTFVHGLSFLSIDGKTDFANMQDQMPQVVRTATERLLVKGG